jgi:hypothetical protein
MSKSAPSNRTGREANIALLPDWNLSSLNAGILPGGLNMIEFQFDSSMPGPNDETTVFRGHVDNTDQTSFEGFCDSERAINLSLEIAGAPHTFYGVISPSGKKMVGFIDPPIIIGDAAVEEEASWSAQASGGPGEGGQAKKSRKAAKKSRK